MTGGAALQDEMSDGQLDLGTLDTLTSYFVLQNAEAEYGWTPEKAGLTVDQANEAAAAFNKFDNNDDYRLGAAPPLALCLAAPRQSLRTLQVVMPRARRGTCSEPCQTDACAGA